MSHIHLRGRNSSYLLAGCLNSRGSDQWGKRCVVRGIPRRENDSHLKGIGARERKGGSQKLFPFSTLEVEA